MDWNQRTIQTYDNSAKALAEYFGGIGARTKDIELGLKLAKAVDGAKVVEIGCGDGRDAEQIIKRVLWYEGFDPSRGLLDLAKRKLPEASFKIDNALTYDYPSDIDVVFAFASLLHVDINDLKIVFSKVYQSLKAEGVFFISLKERPSYQEEVTKDKHGERMFYYYSIDVVLEIAAKNFELIHENHYRFGKTDWFKAAFKKK